MSTIYLDILIFKVCGQIQDLIDFLSAKPSSETFWTQDSIKYVRKTGPCYFSARLWNLQCGAFDQFCF
ncbi:hypothetical protein ABKV19_021283 [Rosa sericea]